MFPASGVRYFLIQSLGVALRMDCSCSLRGADSESWGRGWHPCGSHLRHLRPSAIHRAVLLALGLYLTLPPLRPNSRLPRSVNARVSAALTLPIVPCLADDASSHSGKLGREIDLVRATSRKTGFHRKNIVMYRATTRCLPSHVRWGCCSRSASGLRSPTLSGSCF